MFLLGTAFMFCVLSASFFFGSAYFIYSKKASLTHLSLELSGISAEEAYYHTLKKGLSDTVAAQKSLDSYFISQDDFVPFVEKIEALGAHAGVALTVESAALTDSNRTLALTLFATGTFEQALYFLSLLESFPSKITFERAWVAKSAANREPQTARAPWEGRFTVGFASN